MLLVLAKGFCDHLAACYHPNVLHPGPGAFAPVSLFFEQERLGLPHQIQQEAESRKL
jgi:hypothetical protein